MPYTSFSNIITDVSHSNNPASLAYSTARTRWPKIVIEAIADVEASLSKHAQATAEFEDGKEVVEGLKSLLLKLESDARLMPILEDGTSAIKDFNDELKSLGPVSWHNSPWLFCENYLYRLINTCFSRRRTSFWKSYDVFAIQKTSALKSSKSVVVELVQWYLEIDRKTHEDKLKGKENLKAVVEEMIQVSLWGNATDLLLLISISTEELQSRQGKKSRELSKKNVVDDDTEQVWGLLSSLRNGSPNREIHIVLDNAGFELITDLILAAYLLAAHYATRIVLHGKDIPWFVSDVTASDLETTLQTLEIPSFSHPATEREALSLKLFAKELRNHFASDRLCYESHPFWTTQHPYARLPELAPKLYAQLAAAELVIFKGDLNYRKLVFDGLWPRTTTFQHALGPLGETAGEGTPGLRILALRTCKADTCVGLAPGREEELDLEGNGEWTRTGKYAVVSYYDGKSTTYELL